MMAVAVIVVNAQPGLIVFKGGVPMVPAAFRTVKVKVAGPMGVGAYVAPVRASVMVASAWVRAVTRGMVEPRLGEPSHLQRSRL